MRLLGVRDLTSGKGDVIFLDPVSGRQGHRGAWLIVLGGVRGTGHVAVHATTYPNTFGEEELGPESSRGPAAPSSPWLCLGRGETAWELMARKNMVAFSAT